MVQSRMGFALIGAGNKSKDALSSSASFADATEKVCKDLPSRLAYNILLLGSHVYFL